MTLVGDRLASRRSAALLAVGAVAIGWWLGSLFAPGAFDRSVVQPMREAWQLELPPRQVDQTALAAVVMSAPFWGSAAQATSAPVVPVIDERWRIAAVFGQGKDRNVLVVFSAEGKPPSRLGVGDKLPSGHRIVSVGERDVCIQIGRKTYRMGVEAGAL